MIKEVMRDVRVERAMHVEVTRRWRRALEKIPSDFELDSDSERTSSWTRTRKGFQIGLGRSQADSCCHTTGRWLFGIGFWSCIRLGLGVEFVVDYVLLVLVRL